MKIYRPINSKDSKAFFDMIKLPATFLSLAGGIGRFSWCGLIGDTRTTKYWKINASVKSSWTQQQFSSWLSTSHLEPLKSCTIFYLDSHFSTSIKRDAYVDCVYSILILFEKCQFYRPSSKCFTTQSFLEFSSWNRKWEKWSVHRSFRGRGVTPVVVSART